MQHLTGSFTVHAIDIDDFGDVRSFNASFVQHCDGMTPALRGSFRYANPGQQPELPTYVPPAPDPEPQIHRRSVSLKIEGRWARGYVKMSGNTVLGCVSEVPVKLQRKVKGVFETVQLMNTTTHAAYYFRVGRKLGVYRVVAVKKMLRNGDTCARPESNSWHY